MTVTRFNYNFRIIKIENLLRLAATIGLTRAAHKNLKKKLDRFEKLEITFTENKSIILDIFSYYKNKIENSNKKFQNIF